MISKSSGKITKVSNADDVEIKYGHIIQVLTDWIDTTILVSVDGRGTAKSTVIQARRSGWQDIKTDTRMKPVLVEQ